MIGNFPDVKKSSRIDNRAKYLISELSASNIEVIILGTDWSMKYEVAEKY